MCRDLACAIPAGRNRLLCGLVVYICYICYADLYCTACVMGVGNLVRSAYLFLGGVGTGVALTILVLARRMSDADARLRAIEARAQHAEQRARAPVHAHTANKKCLSHPLRGSALQTSASMGPGQRTKRKPTDNGASRAAVVVGADVKHVRPARGRRHCS